MTKNEELRQFAAMAMQGLCASMTKAYQPREIVAEKALVYAQALQAALDAIEQNSVEEVQKRCTHEWRNLGPGETNIIDEYEVCGRCGARR